MLRALSALLLVGAMVLPVSSAGADEGVTVRHRMHHSRIWVRPETHVVEVAIRPPGRSYIINGRYYTATSDACSAWGPRQRVSLVSGDWHGWCWTAVFHNLTLRSDCEMYCY